MKIAVFSQKDLRFPRYAQQSQAGRSEYNFPIITGLEKSNRVIAQEPFATYYEYFRRCLRNNSRLLIIGYGFADTYINQAILSSYIDANHTHQRVVLVDKIKDGKKTIFDGINAQTGQDFIRLFSRDWKLIGKDPLERAKYQNEYYRAFFNGFLYENTQTELICNFFETQEK